MIEQELSEWADLLELLDDSSSEVQLDIFASSEFRDIITPAL